MKSLLNGDPYYYTHYISLHKDLFVHRIIMYYIILYHIISYYIIYTLREPQGVWVHCIETPALRSPLGYHFLGMFMDFYDLFNVFYIYIFFLLIFI